MIKILWFASLLLLCQCRFFEDRVTVIEVGAVQFNQKYFADRYVEKLKNLDGLNVKDANLTQTMSHELTDELIVEGYLYNWAQAQRLQVTPQQIRDFAETLFKTTDGVPTDFVFETRPSKNLFEDAVRVQLIKQELNHYLAKTIVIPEEEIAEYYKHHRDEFSGPKIWLKQIFLEKEADAESVLQFLKKTQTPFEDLAVKYSLSPEGKRGGDIGWVTPKTAAHIAPLFNAPLGVYPQFLKGPQGYHIYKIVQSKKGTTQSPQEARPQVEAALRQEKLGQGYLLWLQEQVKNVKVKTNEELISAFRASYQESL